MSPLTIDSLTQMLTPELLEQLAIPAAALLAFMWLFSRHRSATASHRSAVAALAANRGDAEAEGIGMAGTNADMRARALDSIPEEPAQSAQQERPADTQLGGANAFARYTHGGELPEGSLYSFPAQAPYLAHPFRATVAGYPVDFVAHPADLRQQQPAGLQLLPQQLHGGFVGFTQQHPIGFPPLPAVVHRQPATLAGAHPRSQPIESVSRSGLSFLPVKKEVSFNTLWNRYRDRDSDSGSEMQPSRDPLPVRAALRAGSSEPASTAEGFARGSSKGKTRTTGKAAPKAQSVVSDNEGDHLNTLSRAKTPVRPPSTPRRSSRLIEPLTSTASTATTSVATPSRSVPPPETSKLSVKALLAQYPRQFNERASKKDGTGPTIITAWFESSGDYGLSHPPDLGNHPELEEGDLFCHTGKATNKRQAWIWTKNAATSCWLRVYWGHVRDDGLLLTLTPSESKPSWVPAKRYKVRTKEVGNASPLKESDDEESE